MCAVHPVADCLSPTVRSHSAVIALYHLLSAFCPPFPFIAAFVTVRIHKNFPPKSDYRTFFEMQIHKDRISVS